MVIQVVLSDGSEIVLIHYIKDSRIVCMPNLAVKDICAGKGRPEPHMRTDAIVAVTCPLCKELLK